jgi:hypothetical protein
VEVIFLFFFISIDDAIGIKSFSLSPLGERVGDRG